jgi:general secretion pathway protein D
VRSRFIPAISFVVMLWAVPASAVPILSVSPVSGTATVGGTTTVDIVVTDAEDLYGFQLDLLFDPTIVEVTGILEGAFLATGGTTFFDPGLIDNTAGTVSFLFDTLVGSIPGVTGGGVLATITLTGLAAGTSGLELLNAIVIDSTLTEVTSITSGGSVTVTAGGGGGTERVPEPGTLLLLATGAAAALRSLRRRPGAALAA